MITIGTKVKIVKIIDLPNQNYYPGAVYRRQVGKIGMVVDIEPGAYMRQYVVEVQGQRLWYAAAELDAMPEQLPLFATSLPDEFGTENWGKSPVENLYVMHRQYSSIRDLLARIFGVSKDKLK
jgi:hypothetical protein